MRFVTRTRWEMDVSFLVLISAIMRVCLCVSGTTVESRCPHACTNLFKITRLFLSSSEELISEFRLCLSSVYHMIYLTIHVKEAWTSRSYRERSSPLDFYATILLMMMSKLCEPFVIRGGLYEKTIIWENKPRMFIKQNRQLQLWSIDLISFLLNGIFIQIKG